VKNDHKTGGTIVSNWEENVRKVVPYTPGEQPKLTKMIKLNTNENPYPPAPAVSEVIKNFPVERLRLYPDPVIGDLVKGIADFYQVSEEEVFVGVGSDDVLAMIFLTFFNSKKPILFPDITYSFYDVWADMLRIPYRTVPLDADFRIRPQDYTVPNGGVVFPNPNAPTGELLPLDAVEQIIAANPDVVVVVDEAYIDFGGESALPLICKYDNLIVTRTFSKSRSLAGSRIGYAFGNARLIKYLNDVKYSFNSYTMDSLTIAIGSAAVGDRAYFEETTRRIIETREWTKKELAALGFTFGDSKSNFIFATHPKLDMVELFEKLKKAHIYVRHFNKPERIVPYLRISIGTDEEMRTLIDFLRGYMGQVLG
jgi:histidinol-phosphate aminotransferase